MERLGDALPDEQVAQRWIVSDDPEEVVAAVKQYVDWGFTHLVFHGPGPDQSRFLDTFAEPGAAGAARARLTAIRCVPPIPSDQPRTYPGAMSETTVSRSRAPGGRRSPADSAARRHTSNASTTSRRAAWTSTARPPSSRLSCPRPPRILDAGCGTGRVATQLTSLGLRLRGGRRRRRHGRGGRASRPCHPLGAPGPQPARAAHAGVRARRPGRQRHPAAGPRHPAGGRRAAHGAPAAGRRCSSPGSGSTPTTCRRGARSPRSPTTTAPATSPGCRSCGATPPGTVSRGDPEAGYAVSVHRLND